MAFAVDTSEVFVVVLLVAYAWVAVYYVAYEMMEVYYVAFEIMVVEEVYDMAKGVGESYHHWEHDLADIDISLAVEV